MDIFNEHLLSISIFRHEIQPVGRRYIPGISYRRKMEMYPSGNVYGQGGYSYGVPPGMMQTQTSNNKNTKTILIVIGVIVIVLLVIGLVWWLASGSSSNSGSSSVAGVPTSGSSVSSVQSRNVSSSTSSSNSARSSVLQLPQNPPQSDSGPDPLADPNNPESSPSIWIGEAKQSDDGYLITPGYGYFYPRLLNGKNITPVVDTAAVSGNTLYAHVNTPGIQGVYSVVTDVDDSKWQLYISTGSNPQPGMIDGRTVLDINPTSQVTDMYFDGSNLYMVTDSGIYEVTAGTITLSDKTQGVLGGDSNNGITVYLADDSLIMQGKPVTIKDKTLRSDVPSYVKYVQPTAGVYAIATRDSIGNVGYSSGNQQGQSSDQIPSNVKAFSAMNGYFCCVDTDGRVMINEYDSDSSGFKYPTGIPYNVTIPADDDFRVTVTMGGDRVYLFSCQENGMNSNNSNNNGNDQ